ncbi:glycosyl transferase family 2 [Kushneria sinocarnis]|uniref:Glycosyl transferase family 2 n=1 Tax=Kushneria sinocarnis TaxID=595502 RepID=A0A420X016_9GAMM|nr:glycosyltransferase family 2 protein [Kushneria sinocarnis]RKR06951.1 glycosyl transferase family 2 [Kushneria sinocarnis]
MAPTVTVLMPAYNRADVIPWAIDSVLRQTLDDFELLIVDDASTDSTASVVEGYTDPRIRLIRQTGNQGPARTRNHGLELARGRYIAILDSDDQAVPSRLARQVAFLEQHPDIGEVGGWIRAIDATGRRGRLKRMPTDSRRIRAQMPWRCGIAHTTVMIRTELARQLRYDEAFELSQDIDLHVRLLASHEIANIPAVMTCKRTHATQISRNSDKAARYKKIIQRRLLEQLGLEPSEKELDRHFALGRKQKTDQRTGAEHFQWAHDWLATLVHQNMLYRIFPEPEFSRYANRVWRQLCRSEWRRLPWQASRGLLQPL